MIYCPNWEMFKNERVLTGWNTKATHELGLWAANQGKKVVGCIQIGIMTDIHARRTGRENNLEY